MTDREKWHRRGGGSEKASVGAPICTKNSVMRRAGLRSPDRGRGPGPPGRTGLDFVPHTPTLPHSDQPQTFHISPSTQALLERRNSGSWVRRSVSVCSPRSRRPVLSGGCPWPFPHPFSKASFALSLNLIKYLCAQATGVRKRVYFTYTILK